ncbi:MAG TPA: tetratricopeptide repeat protein [Gemmatimonadaceae bacterium]|nr:tetratricopeptide repeat protein [Gemmatimonadaceae bacterium]
MNDRTDARARGANSGPDAEHTPARERDFGPTRPRVADAPVEGSAASLGAADAPLNPFLVAAEEFIRQGNLAGALGELGRALDEHPDDVSILCARASLYLHQQRLEPAEADLRRASKLDPGNPEVLFGLGTLFCKKARWREAIEPLQRVVELDPMRASGHYYLGEAYNQTDQLKPALGSYEAAVRLEPNNWRALKGVGIVLDKMGRPTEATVAYQKAREAQRR